MVLANLAFVADIRGDDSQAMQYFEQALALSNSINDRAQAASTSNFLGIAQQGVGDLPAALHTYALALPLARATGNHQLESMIIYNTGVVHKELGDYGQALDFYSQSLERFRRSGTSTVKRRFSTPSAMFTARWGRAKRRSVLRRGAPDLPSARLSR